MMCDLIIIQNKAGSPLLPLSDSPHSASKSAKKYNHLDLMRETSGAPAWQETRA